MSWEDDMYPRPAGEGWARGGIVLRHMRNPWPIGGWVKREPGWVGIVNDQDRPGRRGTGSDQVTWYPADAVESVLEEVKQP